MQVKQHTYYIGVPPGMHPDEARIHIQEALRLCGVDEATFVDANGLYHGQWARTIVVTVIGLGQPDELFASDVGTRLHQMWVLETEQPVDAWAVRL